MSEKYTPTQQVEAALELATRLYHYQQCVIEYLNRKENGSFHFTDAELLAIYHPSNGKEFFHFCGTDRDRDWVTEEIPDAVLLVPFNEIGAWVEADFKRKKAEYEAYRLEEEERKNKEAQKILKQQAEQRYQLFLQLKREYEGEE